LIKIIHSNESLPKRWDIANERSDDDVLKTGVEVTGMFYTISLPSLVQSSIFPKDKGDIPHEKA
jgi:hypothetical protein